jgi:hypothetical protein
MFGDLARKLYEYVLPVVGGAKGTLIDKMQLDIDRRPLFFHLLEGCRERVHEPFYCGDRVC